MCYRSLLFGFLSVFACVNTSLGDVIVVGDSTAITGPAYVGCSSDTLYGWGSLLAGNGVTDTIVNESISGASTRSYYQNSPGAPLSVPPVDMGIGVPHWDSVLNGDGMATSGIQAGDTVVIALGINDQDFVGADPNKSTTLGAMGTYQAFLNLYVDQILARGATPVLVTPAHNFGYSGGVFNFAGANREFADPYNRAEIIRNVVAPATMSRPAIDVIDLEQHTFDVFSANAIDVPGTYGACDGDVVHLSEFGANNQAAFIASQLNAIAVPEPSAFLCLATSALLVAGSRWRRAMGRQNRCRNLGLPFFGGF